MPITPASDIGQVVLVDALLPVLSKTSKLPESSVRICFVSYWIMISPPAWHRANGSADIIWPKHAPLNSSQEIHLTKELSTPWPDFSTSDKPSSPAWNATAATLRFRTSIFFFFTARAPTPPRCIAPWHRSRVPRTPEWSKSEGSIATCPASFFKICCERHGRCSCGWRGVCALLALQLRRLVVIRRWCIRGVVWVRERFWSRLMRRVRTWGWVTTQAIVEKGRPVEW